MPIDTKGKIRQKKIENSEKNKKKSWQKGDYGTYISRAAKHEILKSLMKGEYDLDAIGLGHLPSSEKLIATIVNIIEDMAEKHQDALMVACIKAIFENLKIWLDRDEKGNLSVTFCLWEELWESPIDYHNFKFLEFDENDVEDEPALNSAIEQLSQIVNQLREHNKQVKKREEKNV